MKKPTTSEKEKVQSPVPAGIVCPVCGKSLDKNVPTKTEIIDNELYDGELRIVDSRVTIQYPFDHYFDEEEKMTMEEPHQLTVFIGAEFDGAGVCTAFTILRVCPGES